MINKSIPRVALPETRQLDVLAGLLERRGVEVVRCPMISIRDAPDRESVVAWIRRFCDRQIDLCVFYTGEGIDRLTGFAEAAGLKDRFLAALRDIPLLTRGPKPARALRRFGVKPEHPALEPTTEGIIETLGRLDLDGRCVGVQLYGDEPQPELTGFLESRGARPDCVAPYVYAAEADDEAVKALIASILAGDVDAIAFTSKSQVERLARVAGRQDGRGLDRLLEPVIVAAVGPVAAAALGEAGVRVDVVPESDFFMKPMVSALMNHLEKTGSDPISDRGS